MLLKIKNLLHAVFAQKWLLFEHWHVPEHVVRPTDESHIAE
jgi:hypothetical protein